MRTYAELGHVHRGEPCVEYPGQWFVLIGGAERYACTDREEAVRAATAFSKVDENWDYTISVFWSCSDNDPRVGQVWFTGCYTFISWRHGKAAW